MKEHEQTTNYRMKVPYHSWYWQYLVGRGWTTMEVTEPDPITKIQTALMLSKNKYPVVIEEK